MCDRKSVNVDKVAKEQAMVMHSACRRTGRTSVERNDCEGSSCRQLAWDMGCNPIRPLRKSSAAVVYGVVSVPLGAGCIERGRLRVVSCQRSSGLRQLMLLCPYANAGTWTNVAC